ncbi:MAG: fimbrillin family protein [Marinifilaceae bacterium]
MKKNILKSIGLFTVLITMTIGCSKVDIDSGCCCDKNDTIQSGKRISMIQFNANLNDEVSRANTTPLPIKRYATIYAFLTGTDNMNDIASFATYKSYSAGSLAPVGIADKDTTYMVLAGGDYDFFAVTTSDTLNHNPLFISDPSPIISNGIDYLWSKTSNQPIYTNYANVNFTFQHSCAQIVLDITGGGNVYLTGIKKAVMQVPDTTNSAWNIFTGIVTPSTNLVASDTIPMGILSSGDGSTAYGGRTQLVIVPYSGQDEFPIFLTLLAAVGETTPQSVRAKGSILPPAGGFKAGYSYMYTIEYNGTNITSNQNSDNVLNWTPVDEKGNPLVSMETK